jgi:hypothetical protein
MKNEIIEESPTEDYSEMISNRNVINKNKK